MHQSSMIKGKLKLEIDMTASEAAALLQALYDKDFRGKLKTKLDVLEPYGVKKAEEDPLSSGHEFVVPSAELLNEIRGAIRRSAVSELPNPPAFAICSRIAIAAYAAAAAPQ